ncbi:helix-turn-helix domain-containing protein [Arthrobacter alkaliphilus]
MVSSSWSARTAIVASLGDPTRRALFDYLRQAGKPVGRDELAHALELPRAVAATQLDRMAREGILSVSFSKTGPGGPGTGRPAKRYAAVTTEVLASVPERSYELIGDLIAAAAERSMVNEESVEQNARAVGRERGYELGQAHGTIEGVLEATGYSPLSIDDGTIEFTNCPFHRLALDHPMLVCCLSGALLEGALEGCGDATRSVEAVSPGHGGSQCCARLIRRS